MGIQLSPGIVANEIDLSQVVVGTATTGGALAGPSTWGPAGVKTLVDNETTLVNTFGKPDTDTYTTFFTGQSFLAYGNNLTFVRALSSTARNAAIDGDGLGAIAITSAGSGYVHVPTISFTGGSGTGAAATATTDGSHITSVTVTNPGSGYTVDDPPTVVIAPQGGDTPVAAVLTAYVGIVIQNNTVYENLYATGAGNVGPFAAKFAGAFANDITIAMCDSSGQFTDWTYSDYFSGAPGTSAYTANLGGSHDQIHVVVVDASGLITGVPGEVLERFPYLSKAVDALDAQGNSIYYPYVLQRQSKYIYWMDFPTNAAVAAQLTTGSLTTGIKYVAVTPGTAGNAITVHYVNPGTNNATLGVVVSGSAITVNLATDGSAVATSTAALVEAAVNASTPASALVTASLVSDGSGLVAVNSATQLAGGLATETNNWGVTAKGTSFTQMYVAYLDILVGGNDGNDTMEDADLITAYDQFLAEDFYFGLLLTADHSTTVVNYCLEDISEFRTDNITFISPKYADVVNNVGSEAAACVTTRNEYPSNNYGVMCSQWFKKYDQYNDVYRWIPDNGDVAGLCVRTDQVRAPWFSPAGLNRGQILNVTQLAWNPRQAFRDVLYQANINPIVQFPGQGTILYGDKTLQTEPSAFDRINVRRLFIVMRTAIKKAAQYILFELNDDITRGQFVALVDPYLREIEGGRGIYDYQIRCDSTNNTPELIDQNGFRGDILVKPAKSINFIQLNFVATTTGISFSEVEF